MKQINICPVCGGKLEKRETEFVCLYCNGVFQEDTVQDIEEKMNNMLDKFKQELVANTRTQLWDAIHEKYLSSERILNLSRNIKTYLPDDFLANFFEFVNTKSHTQEQINEYINNIDYKEYYYLVDVVLDFMIRSLEPANLLCLNNLIENAYKQNYLKLYNEYTSRLSKEAEKVKSGVYDLTMERDVFVAYSSKDIKYVEEVVKLLNQEGISYFVALENLRHGKGAVENYDKALEQAMENSKTFLFISSENSRTRECDALKKEIPYLKKLDKLNAPAEFRNDYSKIPFQYKKPRVQLLIGDKPKGTLGDKQVAEVFDGYEWRYDAESAVEAIYNFLNEDFVVETDAERIKRELEENQAKMIEELLNKRMAEMMANQNKPKEPEPKKEDSEAEKLRKELEELKKALNDKNTVEKTNALTPKEPVKTEPVIQEETPKKQGLKKPIEEKKNIEISNTSGVDASTKEEPKKTSEPEETNVIEERKTITFGAYYRYNKKKEPLKWDILEEKDGKALIITHDIIEAKAFDENNIRNYKESSIRKWLNNEFYKAVFDDENKKKIQLTLVDNSLASTCEDNNPYVCEDTKDNIFLLSVSEIKTYFKSYDSRKASGTRYALGQGLNVKKDGNSPWFLRSPSHVNSDGQIRCVDYDGSLYIYGAENTWMGIRPACWIDLGDIKNEKEPKSKKEDSEAEHLIGKIEELKKSLDGNKTKESKISNEKATTSIVKEERKTITFGSYFNQNDKELEPLKWDILEEKNGKALIITHEIINSIAFNENKSNNYEKSSIRRWLNSDFYNIAFNEEEKKCIQLTLVDNSLSSTSDDSNRYICNDTKDNIFLLSVKEATKYYKTDDERQLKGTEFAKKRGLYIGKDTGNSYWLLRSPYFDDSKDSYCINDDGNINYHSYVYFDYGVRPACWIYIDEKKKQDDKKKEELKKATSEVVEQKPANIFKREGNVVTFGSYYNHNDIRKEPLKWDIIDKKDGKLLIITHDIVELGVFDKESNNYKKSSIRKWINENFYNDAFTDEDKERILLTLVDNSPESTGYDKNKYACNNTKDYMFLLSVKELNAYYKSDNKRTAKGTHYAYRKFKMDDDKSCSWYLRSPDDMKSNRVYSVGEWGKYSYDHTDEIDKEYFGIRPACWIKADNKTVILPDELNVKKEKNAGVKSEKTSNQNTPKLAIREGNTIIFGSYYENDREKTEPLKWDILDERDGQALIITHEVVDITYYGYDYNSNNYEKSAIRKWLKEEFYNTAFKESEKKTILSAIVDNSMDEDGYKNEKAGKNTKDKVFILSVQEAKKYYKRNELRKAKGTKDVIKGVPNNKGYVAWWLRTVSASSRQLVSHVTYDGKIEMVFNSSVGIGVRPACWIDLSYCKVNPVVKNDIELLKQKKTSKNEENKLSKIVTESKPSSKNIKVENDVSSKIIIKDANSSNVIEKKAEEKIVLETEKKTLNKKNELKKLTTDKSDLVVESKPKNTFKREGNTVLFGSYYDEDDEILAPLKWDILEEKDGKVLIITHNIIDSIAFDSNESNNYEKSPIRAWLNNDFYNLAFSDEDKKKIQNTLVDNSAESTGIGENKYVCNDTNDNIFLLSVKELNTYYQNNEAKRAKGTPYAVSKNLYVYEKIGSSDWMLRSPNNYKNDTKVVDSEGKILNNFVWSASGVRPACWIDLSYCKVNPVVKNDIELLKQKKTSKNEENKLSKIVTESKPSSKDIKVENDVSSKKIIKDANSSNVIEKKAEEKEETNKQVPKALLVSSSKLGTMSIADLAPYETIIIKDGEERLEKHLFGFAKNVKAVMIPNSIKSIGALCFSMDKENLDVYYDGTLTDWLKVKVEGSPARKSFNLYVRDPKGEVIRRNKNYTKLINLIINKDNRADETIGSHQFAMSNIETVNISGIKVISERAFINCDKIKDVKLADVEKISKDAFFCCSYMETITLPKSLTDVSFSAFACCYSLTTIYMKRKKPLLGLPKGFEKEWEKDAKIVWGAK